MKKLLFSLTLTLLLSITSSSQVKYKIVSVDSVKNRVVFFTCQELIEDSIYTLITRSRCNGWMAFRGMGKKPKLVGRYIQEKYSKRLKRNIFVILQ